MTTAAPHHSTAANFEQAAEYVSRANEQLALARKELKLATLASKRGDMVSVCNHVARSDGHQENAAMAFANARRAMGQE